MKTLAEILFLWQFSVFSSTSNIVFLFVKGSAVVHPSYVALRAEAKITDIEDTLKWKQVKKKIRENFTNLPVEKNCKLCQETNDDLSCWDI